MRAESNTRAILAVAVVAAVVISAAGVAVVSAAGGTTVSLDPTSETVDSGATQTIGVVVDDANGGVGAYDVTVASSDPGVVSIVNATPRGNPTNSLVTTTYADDNSSVSARVATADTGNSGRVTFLTVTVRGGNVGTSDLSVTVNALGDESGESYDVSSTTGATVTVAGATTTQTATATPTPTTTATQTSTPTATTTTAQTTAATTTRNTTETTSAPTATATQTTTTTTTPATVTTTETTTSSGENGTSTGAGGTNGATEPTTTNGNGASGSGSASDHADRVRSVRAALTGSSLTDARVNGVSSALAGSGLTRGQFDAITGALSGDGLSDEQRQTIADAITTDDLSENQLAALADALGDGVLTPDERASLGFLGSAPGAQPGYYQVDLVAGQPIEHLRRPNYYTSDELVRFAHGNTVDGVTRVSDGEFTTNATLADRIESRNVTVENGTATTTFTVADGSGPVTLTLASYRKVGPGWSPTTEAEQTFVDSETQTVTAGTHTLTVDLPEDSSRNSSKK